MKMRGVFASLLLAGCSTHPISADVTLDTYSIATHVECEAYRALSSVLAGYLVKHDDPYLQQLGRDLFSGLQGKNGRHLNKLTVDELLRLSATDRTKIVPWDAVRIGFGYTFKITEKNDNGGSAAVNVPIGIATLTVGVAAAANRARESLREFEIVMKLSELIKSQACDAPRARDGNAHTYPISGQIGLVESFGTFTALWLSSGENLKGPGRTIGTKLDGFVDQITFTTTIGGGITPEVTLAAVKTGPRVTKGTLSHASSRTDAHKLILVIVPPS
ncbi:MAG TPA: hypothetical protein PK264_19400, partial [Hyphomicrobiaceae bacterium]|nr:hypothetical protein [Hyphomicrobiaceae bacterium]